MTKRVLQPGVFFTDEVIVVEQGDSLYGAPDGERTVVVSTATPAVYLAMGATLAGVTICNVESLEIRAHSDSTIQDVQLLDCEVVVMYMGDHYIGIGR